MGDQDKKPADGRVHEQQNPSGAKSNYDDAGDEVEKDTSGKWVKKQQSQGASKTTTPTPSPSPPPRQ